MPYAPGSGYGVTKHTYRTGYWKGSTMKVGMGKPALVRLASALVLLIAASACGVENPVSTIQTDRQSVEQGAASTATVRIDMASGTLNLTDGSSKLMDATFQYNTPDWKPQVTYEVTGTAGLLSLVQPVDRNNLLTSNGIYDWEIRLGGHVPVDLELRLGLGKATLDLSRLKVSSLDMKLGSGGVEANLGGNYETDVGAHITGGVGNFTLRLGHRMATRVTVKGNLGKVTVLGLTQEGNTYTNSKESPRTLNVEIERGIGEITLDGR